MENKDLKKTIEITGQIVEMLKELPVEEMVAILQSTKQILGVKETKLLQYLRFTS